LQYIAIQYNARTNNQVNIYGHMYSNVSSGRGVAPARPPFALTQYMQLKYNVVRFHNKGQVVESWLAEFHEVIGVGGGPGLEPHGLHYFYKAKYEPIK
jgi:hypothetical protein